MEENANKLHFQCTSFNFCMRVTVYAECIYVFLSKSCPGRWIYTMLIVEKHYIDICCDEFPVPQIDSKSKQIKEQWHEKFYLQSAWGKLAILNT